MDIPSGTLGLIRLFSLLRRKEIGRLSVSVKGKHEISSHIIDEDKYQTEFYEAPDYLEPKPTLHGLHSITSLAAGEYVNQDYYRDLVTWNYRKQFHPLTLEFENTGSICLNDINLTIEMNKPRILIIGCDIFKNPKKRTSFTQSIVSPWNKPATVVETSAGKVKIILNKLQPRESLLIPNAVYIGCRRFGLATVTMKATADQIISLIPRDISINFVKSQ